MHQQLQVRTRQTPGPPHEVTVAIVCRRVHMCVRICLHRQGLLHLTELVRHPVIFITLEGQSKRMRPEVKQQLSEHQHRLTVLTWKHNSVVGPAAAAATHNRSRANRFTLTHAATLHCAFKCLFFFLISRGSSELLLISKYMMVNCCGFTSFLNIYR